MKKMILLWGTCTNQFVVLRTVLESSGYQVDLAEDKKQAFAQVNKKKPLLVIYLATENEQDAQELKLSVNKNVSFWAIPEKNGQISIGSNEILEKVHNLIG